MSNQVSEILRSLEHVNGKDDIGPREVIRLRRLAKAVDMVPPEDAGDGWRLLCDVRAADAETPEPKAPEPKAKAAPKATPAPARGGLEGAIADIVRAELEANGGINAEQLQATVESAVAEAIQKTAFPVTVRVERPEREPIAFESAHRQLPQLIRMLSARRADGKPVIPWVWGGAGAGKTYATQQAAEALGVGWSYQGPIHDKTEYLGYISPITGEYQRTDFRDWWEFGDRLHVLDEVDGGEGNEMLGLNAAFAGSDWMQFPDGMVKRADNAYLALCANTNGCGATISYVTRKALDGATMDRFPLLHWDIDASIEQRLAMGKAQWYARVLAIRGAVKSLGLDLLVTPRATENGAALIEAGFTPDEAERAVIWDRVDADTKAEVLAHV